MSAPSSNPNAVADSSASGDGRRARLRRAVSSLVIAAYLATIGLHLGKQAIRDYDLRPATFFWTWDMFPDYGCFSTRRHAVAETRSGRYVDLFASPTLRFRVGTGAGMTRFDRALSEDVLRQAVEKLWRQYNSAAPDDPVVNVTVVEESWPVVQNLPDGLRRTFVDSPAGPSGRPSRRTAVRVLFRLTEPPP